MADQIADCTWLYNNVNCNCTSTSTLCPTKSQIVGYGCRDSGNSLIISGTYADNQLVCQKDMSLYTTQIPIVDNTYVQLGIMLFNTNNALSGTNNDIVGLKAMYQFVQGTGSSYPNIVKYEQSFGTAQCTFVSSGTAYYLYKIDVSNIKYLNGSNVETYVTTGTDFTCNKVTGNETYYFGSFLVPYANVGDGIHQYFLPDMTYERNNRAKYLNQGALFIEMTIGYLTVTSTSSTLSIGLSTFVTVYPVTYIKARQPNSSSDITIYVYRIALNKTSNGTHVFNLLHNSEEGVGFIIKEGDVSNYLYPKGWNYIGRVGSFNIMYSSSTTSESTVGDFWVLKSIPYLGDNTYFTIPFYKDSYTTPSNSDFTYTIL